MDNAALLTHLGECRRTGIEYRDKFRPTWDEIEDQIRCIAPSSWAQKEDWQSKIYIGLQAKKREIAKAYLKRMVFGKKRAFDIGGVESADNDDALQIANLTDTLMQAGSFDHQNDFVLQEGVDLGTSFIKLVMKPDGMGIDLLWRSCRNVVYDPDCGHDLDKARFAIDLYRRDIAYVLSGAKEDKNKVVKYNKDVVDQFLSDAKAEVLPAQSNDSNKEPTMSVKSIDGTEDITIPSKYRMVDVDEFWVDVPNDKGEYDKRRIVVLNGKYILSNDENPFGFIPFQWCRIKPRKYDSYGLGYIENTMGLQDLMNSCVNLGFDSLKISAMDIIVIDDNKVKDSTTIKYKPLAVWKMKDINGVKIQRQPMSAISDILRGVTLIDQIDQDVSGVARTAQGTELGGESGDDKTLGEYQLKLQMIDQRFLDVGRFIESDYLIPLVTKIFRIIVNPKLFNQDKVNRLLGMREIDNVEIIDGVAQKKGTKLIPRLDLKKIQGKGEMAYDFKAVGVTQFAGQMEKLQKLRGAMEMALSNPTLTALTKIEKLWKKLWQASEIDDYEEIVRSKEEAKQEMGMGAPNGGGAPGMPPMVHPIPGPAPMLPDAGGITQ